MHNRFVALGGAVALSFGLFAAAPAHAGDLPCSTAKLIVPWKAGGGTHVIFSIFEKVIQELDVKPKIKVVTIPGQGGNKGAKEARGAKADGCTLFAIHQSAITSFLNGRIDFQLRQPSIRSSLLTSTPDIVGAAGGVHLEQPTRNLQKATQGRPRHGQGRRDLRLHQPVLCG